MHALPDGPGLRPGVCCGLLHGWRGAAGAAVHEHSAVDPANNEQRSAQGNGMSDFCSKGGVLPHMEVISSQVYIGLNCFTRCYAISQQ